VQIGREELWWVESPGRDLLPRLGRDRLGIDLFLLEYRQGLPLGVVIEARHAHKGRVVSGATRHNLLDEILPLADADDIPGLGSPRHRLRFLDGFHRVAHEYPSTKDKPLA